MRRRGREQTVNLFAFQDIITGVAGVMLFILLLLVVQLSLRLATQAAELQQQRQEQAAESASTVAPPLEPIEDPYADLERLDAELDQLRRQNQELLNASARNLDAEIQNAQDELAEIVRQAEAAKRKAESLQQQIASQQMSEERKEILRRRDQLREQVEALKQERVRHQSGKLVAFKTTSNASREMWVVDLRDTGAELFDVRNPSETTKVTFDSLELPALAVRQIQSALGEITKTRSIILVLRPSVGGAGAIFLSEFRDAGFNIALELLDEDSLITAASDVSLTDDAEAESP